MDAGQLVAWSAVGAAILFGFVVLAVLDSRRTVAAWLVGGAGALVGVQVEGAHVCTILTVVWLLFTHPTGGNRQVLRSVVLLGSAAALASTVFVGDLVNSKTLALQLLALAVTAVIIAVRAGPEDFAPMLRGVLLICTLGATVALLQVVGVIPTELWHTEISSIGRPAGIWPEPDWVGLYSALGLVLAWRLDLGTLIRTAALSINGLAFVLAFARAAWLALAVSIALIGLARFFAKRHQGKAQVKGRSQAVAVLIVVALCALAASPSLRADLGRRLGTLVASTAEDVSGQARMQQIEGMLYLADSAAPFGHGLSASGRVGVSGILTLTGQARNNVGSNWILALWVDGALLAVPLILFMLYFAARGAALLPGQLLVVVLVNSLFSNGFFMPITWLCLGLTMLAVQQRPIPPVRRPPPVRLTPVEQQRRRLAALATARAAALPAPALPAAAPALPVAAQQ